MKKVLYVLLLLAELFVGACLMSSLWMSYLYIPCIVSAALVVGLLIWQIARWTRTADPAVRRRILCNAALIMMIPIAIFIVVYIAIAAAFVIAFIKNGF